jgi:hypothetical protein
VNLSPLQPISLRLHYHTSARRLRGRFVQAISKTVAPWFSLSA